MNLKKIQYTLVILCCYQIFWSQTIDFGSFKGKPFKLGGGISAGATYFNSNRDASREPFVYNFTGNLNISLYSFSMPISYNFTNLGGTLNYQIPFNFNRISLNPRYKWISGYIGDTSMTFSPYSLAGHQFTGGGIELTPDIPFKISAMYGRFLKAVEDDGNPNSIPSFERWGYGSKLDFVKSKYKIGLIGFYAKDLENSIRQIPTTKNITPKENLVVGVSFESQINKDLKLYLDYSNSSLVQDTRATGDGSNNGLASLLLKGNSSAQNFNAYKVGFDYKIQKTSLGASFERVDPNYQTLGAYFFANDLQNIMINVARPLFKDKVNLTFNAGVQRDNLDNKKAQTTNRIVGTLNTNIKFNEKLTTSISFSNQTTTTNVNPDQFIQINQVNPELNQVDQINFRQLSRNASLNTNYSFPDNKKSKKNITFNYNFNQVANEQGGVIRVGQLSSFHNFNLVYSHFLTKSKWALNSSINYTYNTIGTLDNYTIGPVIGINKKFFEDKLTTQFSTAYNTTKGNNNASQNFNFRITSNYKLLDSHHLNLMISQVFANNKTNTTNNNLSNINDLTITFGYNYNFSGTKKKEKEAKQKKQDVAQLEKEKINVKINNEKQEIKSSAIISNLTKITDTLDIKNLPEIKEKLTVQKDSIAKLLKKFDEATENEKSLLEKTIKEKTNIFDKELQQYLNFKNDYQKMIIDACDKLKTDSKSKVLLSKKYFINKYKLDIDTKGETQNAHIEAIEDELINKNIKIDRKDAFALAQYKLLFEILLEEKIHPLNEWKHVEEIASKETSFYYDLFVKEKGLEKQAESFEVKLMDSYIKKYLDTFSILIK